MANSTVQFRGIPEILRAYENRDAQGWAIWNGKQFMFKGITYEALEETLQLLFKNSNNAIYTLKIFEEVENLKAIKEKSECDGSFNFRLHADGELPPANNPYYVTRENAQPSALTLEVRELKEQIAGLLIERNEPEPPTNRLGLIGEIAEHPVLSQILINAIGALFNKPMPQIQRTIGNVQPQQQQTAPGNLADTVQQLKQYAPDIENQLAKLLNMAKSDPATFNYIIALFDKM